MIDRHATELDRHCWRVDVENDQLRTGANQQQVFAATRPKLGIHWRPAAPAAFADGTGAGRLGPDHGSRSQHGQQAQPGEESTCHTCDPAVEGKCLHGVDPAVGRGSSVLWQEQKVLKAPSNFRETIGVQWFPCR